MSLIMCIVAPVHDLTLIVGVMGILRAKGCAKTEQKKFSYLFFLLDSTTIKHYQNFYIPSIRARCGHLKEHMQ